MHDTASHKLAKCEPLLSFIHTYAYTTIITFTVRDEVKKHMNQSNESNIYWQSVFYFLLHTFSYYFNLPSWSSICFYTNGSQVKIIQFTTFQFYNDIKAIWSSENQYFDFFYFAPCELNCVVCLGCWAAHSHSSQSVMWSQLFLNVSISFSKFY